MVLLALLPVEGGVDSYQYRTTKNDENVRVTQNSWGEEVRHEGTVKGPQNGGLSGTLAGPTTRVPYCRAARQNLSLMLVLSAGGRSSNVEEKCTTAMSLKASNDMPLLPLLFRVEAVEVAEMSCNLRR